VKGGSRRKKGSDEGKNNRPSLRTGYIRARVLLGHLLRASSVREYPGGKGGAAGTEKARAEKKKKRSGISLGVRGEILDAEAYKEGRRGFN